MGVPGGWMSGEHLLGWGRNSGGKLLAIGWKATTFGHLQRKDEREFSVHGVRNSSMFRSSWKAMSTSTCNGAKIVGKDAAQDLHPRARDDDCPRVAVLHSGIHESHICCVIELQHGTKSRHPIQSYALQSALSDAPATCPCHV